MLIDVSYAKTTLVRKCSKLTYIDGLVQDCSNSGVLAMEL